MSAKKKKKKRAKRHRRTVWLVANLAGELHFPLQWFFSRQEAEQLASHLSIGRVYRTTLTTGEGRQ